VFPTVGLSVYGEDEISPRLVSSSLVALVSLDFLVVGGGVRTGSEGRRHEAERKSRSSQLRFEMISMKF